MSEKKKPSGWSAKWPTDEPANKPISIDSPPQPSSKIEFFIEIPVGNGKATLHVENIAFTDIVWFVDIVKGLNGHS